MAFRQRAAAPEVAHSSAEVCGVGVGLGGGPGGNGLAPPGVGSRRRRDPLLNLRRRRSGGGGNRRRRRRRRRRWHGVQRAAVPRDAAGGRRRRRHGMRRRRRRRRHGMRRRRRRRRDGLRRRGRRRRGDRPRRRRWRCRIGAVRRQGAALALAARPSAVAWAFRRGRVPPWPAPQPAARFARATAEAANCMAVNAVVASSSRRRFVMMVSIPGENRGDKVWRSTNKRPHCGGPQKRTWIYF